MFFLYTSSKISSTLSIAERAEFPEQRLWSGASQCQPLLHLCGHSRGVEAGRGGVYDSVCRVSNGKLLGEGAGGIAQV